MKRYSENVQQIYIEYSCQSVISIKLLCKFIETKLWHEWSPVNLLYILQNTFLQKHFWGIASEIYAGVVHRYVVPNVTSSLSHKSEQKISDFDLFRSINIVDEFSNCRIMCVL